jgi:hypothetical protein
MLPDWLVRISLFTISSGATSHLLLARAALSATGWVAACTLVTCVL